PLTTNLSPDGVRRSRADPPSSYPTEHHTRSPLTTTVGIEAVPLPTFSYCQSSLPVSAWTPITPPPVCPGSPPTRQTYCGTPPTVALTGVEYPWPPPSLGTAAFQTTAPVSALRA